MKQLLFLSIVFIYTNILGKAHERNKTYVFKQGSVIYPYDLLTENIDSVKTKIAQSGWKFKIDKKSDKGFIIRFLEWSRDNSDKNLEYYISYKSVQKTNEDGNVITAGESTPLFFFISDNVFNNSVEVYEGKTPLWSFVTGAVTVPIKLRAGSERNLATGLRDRKFDFSNDINIGVSAGVRLRADNKQRLFFNFIGGVSLTSISIDQETTNNFISTKTNASSITPSLGFIVQYDDFQIGIITGWDYLARDLGDKWVYQGRPWYGLGLGLSIFSTTDKNRTND